MLADAINNAEEEIQCNRLAPVLCPRCRRRARLVSRYVRGRGYLQEFACANVRCQWKQVL